MVQPATAQAIIQATTFDIFNTASLPARHELMAQYWSSNIVAHPPTGNTGTGFSTIDRMYDELHAEGREAWTFTKDGGYVDQRGCEYFHPILDTSILAKESDGDWTEASLPLVRTSR